MKRRNPNIHTFCISPTPPNSSPNPNGHPANSDLASIVIKIKNKKFFLHIEVAKSTRTWARRRFADGFRAMEAKMRQMQVELDDVQVELDVTRSNLQRIEKNNEMLEDAVKSLRSQHGTNPRDVGPLTGISSIASPTLSASIPPSESAQAMPPLQAGIQVQAVMPRYLLRRRLVPLPMMMPTLNGDLAAQLYSLRRDFENLKSQLSRDKDELAKSREELGKNRELLEVEVRKRVKEEEGRKALEEELESLSEALFEEANNMVATERKPRAQSETNLRQQQEELREELREAQTQREALKSVLRVVEMEMYLHFPHQFDKSTTPAPAHSTIVLESLPAVSEKVAEAESKDHVSTDWCREIPISIPHSSGSGSRIDTASRNASTATLSSHKVHVKREICSTQAERIH
ncbi:hypothetical protein BT96DRAFT_981492 [Gymnopus androsaceus JB14]|uniref:GDP/GTP exchange factor Sec2 N-terminal domain-containing protein n=1 Tax=Gymnopus androsaceus JB14 TaxID=1447944 RepID=A0A6A4GN53_9AGAR|nr:hypothetical protein BT96DRAFT_981492 [Gymnopus androsaceus JB14]